MNFRFFRTPKARRFHYHPRYYDPTEEKSLYRMNLDRKREENQPSIHFERSERLRKGARINWKFWKNITLLGALLVLTVLVLIDVVGLFPGFILLIVIWQLFRLGERSL